MQKLAYGITKTSKTDNEPTGFLMGSTDWLYAFANRVDFVVSAHKTVFIGLDLQRHAPHEKIDAKSTMLQSRQTAAHFQIGRVSISIVDGMTL